MAMDDDHRESLLALSWPRVSGATCTQPQGPWVSGATDAFKLRCLVPQMHSTPGALSVWCHMHSNSGAWCHRCTQPQGPWVSGATDALNLRGLECLVPQIHSTPGALSAWCTEHQVLCGTAALNLRCLEWKVPQMHSTSGALSAWWHRCTHIISKLLLSCGIYYFWML